MSGRGGWLLMAVFGVVACADDAGGLGPCGPEGCAAECQDHAGDTCDVLKAACRERVFDALACVRGRSGVMPEVRVITPEEYRAEQLTGRDERDDEDAGMPDDGEPDLWSRALALLGLVAPGQGLADARLDSAEASLTGYYDPNLRAITLIDRGKPLDDANVVGTIAHEFVHALQDQEVGLGELADRLAGSTDASFARGCLVEGEASLYEDLTMALLLGYSPDVALWSLDLEWSLKNARRSVATAPSPYAELWLLHYPVGRAFLTDAWLNEGNHGVSRVFWNVPPATVYWMHGQPAHEALEVPLVLRLECDAVEPPPDHSHYAATSMGPFVLFAMTAKNSRDGALFRTEYHWQHSMAWRQDRLTVFAGAGDGVALSWQLRLADRDAARELVESLESVAEDLNLDIERHGTEVEIRAASDAATLEAWPPTDCP